MPREVRDGDYDRFLAIQKAPVEKRHALYILTALSIELARIAHIASEPLVGHIRLAWWREALTELIDGKPPRGHPLLQALATIPTSTLPPLIPMVEAHAADFDPEAATSDYHNAVSGNLHMAWAHTLDANAAAEQENAIRAAAMAYATRVSTSATFPRSLAPLSAMAALARLYAKRPQPSRLARVWRVICT